LESFSGQDAFTLTFAALRQRLVDAVNVRVSNGEFSERGLARILGISQPQIHNVLKGARKLSPETADIILMRLRISVLDLLTPGELGHPTSRQTRPADLLALSSFVESRGIPRKPPSSAPGLDRDEKQEVS
jgi:predicted XRE-type DNA-binding protein